MTSQSTQTDQVCRNREIVKMFALERSSSWPPYWGFNLHMGQWVGVRFIQALEGWIWDNGQGHGSSRLWRAWISLGDSPSCSPLQADEQEILEASYGPFHVNYSLQCCLEIFSYIAKTSVEKYLPIEYLKEVAWHCATNTGLAIRRQKLFPNAVI